jgi:hypothetical protein
MTNPSDSIIYLPFTILIYDIWPKKEGKKKGEDVGYESNLIILG